MFFYFMINESFIDEKVIKIFRVESPLDLNTLDANRFNCPFTADGNLTRSLFVLFEQSYKIIVRLNKSKSILTFVSCQTILSDIIKDLKLSFTKEPLFPMS